MLWQAASSIGVPWASNRGPKWPMMEENRDGYWYFVNMTRDCWEEWITEIMIKRKLYLLVSSLRCSIPPLHEIRKTTNKSIFAKRSILAIGGCNILFAYAKGVRLKPFVELHRVRECTKCSITRLETLLTETDMDIQCFHLCRTQCQGWI